jgi:hypothetical protein
MPQHVDVARGKTFDAALAPVPTLLYTVYLANFIKNKLKLTKGGVIYFEDVSYNLRGIAFPRTASFIQKRKIFLWLSSISAISPRDDTILPSCDWMINYRGTFR